MSCLAQHSEYKHKTAYQEATEQVLRILHNNKKNECSSLSAQYFKVIKDL